MCILPYHEFSCKKVIRHFWRHSALVAELGCPHQGGSHPERPVWLHSTNFAVGRLPPSPTTGICHCGGAPRGVGTSWARVYSHRNHICKEANVVTVSVGFYLKKPIKRDLSLKRKRSFRVTASLVRAAKLCNQSRVSPKVKNHFFTWKLVIAYPCLEKIKQN